MPVESGCSIGQDADLMANWIDLLSSRGWSMLTFVFGDETEDIGKGIAITLY